MLKIRITYNHERPEELEEAIENYEDPGCELYAVEEVIENPEDIKAAAEMEMKHRFKLMNLHFRKLSGGKNYVNTVKN